MYRHLHIFLIALLALAAGGCSDAPDAPETQLTPGAPGTLTINFSNSTRSTASDNSETRISNLAVGLYKLNAAEDAAPVKFVKLSGISANNSHTFTIALDDDMVTQLFNNTNNAECRFYAVANFNDTVQISEKPTIAELKSTVITANFRNLEVQPQFVMAGGGTVTYKSPTGGQRYGSASGKATLYRAAAKISVNVSLPDTIHVNQKGTDDTTYEVWEPEKTAIYALLNNGVKTAVTEPVTTTDEDGNPVFWKPEHAYDYYNSQLVNGSQRKLSDTGSGPYSYRMDVPFYTYPNAWIESPLETNKTTITLTVPWRKRGTNSWQTYFYQVPVTPVTLTHLDRNYSYTVNMNVTMLGSETQDEEKPVEDLTYQIVDWGHQDVNVDMQDFRYLVVNPNVIDVNNEDEVSIPYYSSHPIEITNLTMTFQRFNYYSSGDGDVVKIEVPQSVINASTWTHTVTENEVTKQVTDTMATVHVVRDQPTNQWTLNLKHSLASIWIPRNNNNRDVALTGQSGSGEKTIKASDRNITYFRRPDTADPPYSSYTFTFRVQHKDNPNYYQDITVTQYPGMYIEARRNPGDGTDSNGGGNVGNRKGNVYINNYPTTETGDTYGVSNAVGANSSGNKNPNMYVITISQLDSTSNYLIGDPRMKYIYNNLPQNNNALTTQTTDQDAITSNNSWCRSAPALYPNKNNRRLSYYYPTIETDETKMMIAPKLRIASSFGKSIGAIERYQARRRIATYQELNFPAGRWRLPTYGELLFIIKLSQGGKIPTLFNSGQRYWTAQGLYTVNANGTLSESTSGSGYVRGVYDEWYWEQYTQYSINPTGTNYTYTLGDVKRGTQ